MHELSNDPDFILDTRRGYQPSRTGCPRSDHAVTEPWYSAVASPYAVADEPALADDLPEFHIG